MVCMICKMSKCWSITIFFHLPPNIPDILRTNVQVLPVCGCLISLYCQNDFACKGQKKDILNRLWKLSIYSQISLINLYNNDGLPLLPVWEWYSFVPNPGRFWDLWIHDIMSNLYMENYCNLLEEGFLM